MSETQPMDELDRGRWRRLGRLARILRRPWMDRRQNHELRARVDNVPPDTSEDVRERRRKLARDGGMRPRD